jgi:hypothetical protein
VAISLFGRIGRADYDSGYAAFVKDTSELGVRYRMSDLADINFGYRYIRNSRADRPCRCPARRLRGQPGLHRAHLPAGGLEQLLQRLGSAGGATGGYSGYGGALSSFGGYGAGSSFGYGAGGISDFSGMSSYNRGFGGRLLTGPFGSNSFGTSTGIFRRSRHRLLHRAEDARGSSAQYYPPGGRRLRDGNVGEFQQRRQTGVSSRRHRSARRDASGRQQHRADYERCLREGVLRWWQWYE